MNDLIVIGGGLAGCEAAWQAAERGLQVTLYEMRPGMTTGAHVSDCLAELVCSNSLGSNLPDRASGLLKIELRQMGSLLLECAEATSIPAGGALAVDRNAFAHRVTQAIINHPRIQVERMEVKDIPSSPAVIASGPLTSNSLAESIAHFTDKNHLFFFDAIAPIVEFPSINMEVAYRASRFGRGDHGEGDYINCPFSEAEYNHFVSELCNAERIDLRSFEHEIEQGVRGGVGTFFEGCLPVEILAQRGIKSLAYGPLRPLGLTDLRSGQRPYAVAQLRQDNFSGSLYNLVGFQTNLAFSEQKRVFRLIPGLEKAEFVRYGQMHRNTFIASPILLLPTLQTLAREDLFFSGQITGVEGYIGNIATGLLAGINAARLLGGKNPCSLPRTTMLGALCTYITQATLEEFQPMKANFGILPELEFPEKGGKRERAKVHAQRALQDLDLFLNQNPDFKSE